MTAALLGVKDLQVRFRAASMSMPFTGRKGRYINAVNGVSFTVAPGEALGIVGESGCGKTTLGRAILNLVDVHAGQVSLDGEILSAHDKAAVKKLRTMAAMVFQDPYGSLNPRQSVGGIISEVLHVHGKADSGNSGGRVAELLELVGLSPELLNHRPHQLSGGQCQRVGIARALAIDPRLIIADECLSALDVSIQAQILNLLVELQRKINLAMIFISHDLGVVRYLCSRVAVMYLGRIVEEGPTADIFAAPKHPYTRALLSAVPDIDPDRVLAPAQFLGEPPSPLHLPAGCAFHPRCAYAGDVCRAEPPPALRQRARQGVACHFDLNPMENRET